MFGFFTKWFNWLGWFNKKANVVLLGLDNAGKTTLLHLMENDMIIAHEPTRHPQQGSFKVGNVVFKAHDLGGHTAARRLWQTYFARVDAIVFLIDSSDERRWAEAKAVYEDMMDEPLLAHVNVLILVNKIDIKPHIHFDYICKELSLFANPSVDPLTQRSKFAVATSLTQRRGVHEAFQWLVKQI